MSLNTLHLSPIERRALVLLCTLAPLRSLEVARALQISPANACVTVQALTRRGLLMRVEEQRGHQRYLYWPTALSRGVDRVLREPALRRMNDARGVGRAA